MALFHPIQQTHKTLAFTEETAHAQYFGPARCMPRALEFISPVRHVFDLMLTNAELRDLKARSQKLKATFKVGKEGLSPAFTAALDHAFNSVELIKVKFVDFKDQKKQLAPQLAEKTRSEIVLRVGNVVTLYRRKAGPEAANEE